MQNVMTAATKYAALQTLKIGLNPNHDLTWYDAFRSCNGGHDALAVIKEGLFEVNMVPGFANIVYGGVTEKGNAFMVIYEAALKVALPWYTEFCVKGESDLSETESLVHLETLGFDKEHSREILARLN